MSLIADLRSALKDNLDTIPSVNVSKFALSSPKGTLIHMWPSRVEYHRAYGTPTGFSAVDMTIQAVAEFSNDFAPQATLDRLMDAEGEDSIMEAIESDKTLGGLCDDLICTENSGYEFSVGLDNVARLTSEWVVTIYFST